MASPGGDGPTGSLMAFDWEEQEAEVYLSGVGGYELSLDGKKMVVSRGGGALFVVGTDGAPGDDLSEAAVDTADVVLDLHPAAEWRQIYQEAWRLQRDFFWDAGLGGLDWEAVGDRYASLLPLLGCRDDLRDLIGELIGELSNSHTYVWGGDQGREQPWRSVGQLGAEVERVGDAWKVSRVYHGDPADNVRSPLAEPGVGVAEGAFLQAINHRPFPANEPFYAALDGLAEREVVLTVSDKAEGGHTRDVVVTPTGDDRPLRYADWVRRNREYVAAKTDGKMGYVHIPNMGTAGLVAFETWFYPQLDREGLVVDVRWNGGGFVSQLILERLRRTLVGYDRARSGGVWSYPDSVLNGPFVVLTNEFAGSDGDIFPMAVQVTGIAPVLGARSWGGVVGIRGDKPFVDGGLETQPEFAFWFPGRGWGLENRGVEPDIPVQNLPQDVAAGRDPQLDRAIEELQKLRAEGSWILPEFPPAPIKTREEYQRKEGKR
ncbi:MAG: S41 family peptidase [Pseudomonadota bacterium]